MKVTLKIAGHLRAVGFGDRSRGVAEAELPAGETLDGLLRRFSLGTAVDKIVLVNGRYAGPGRVLKEGDLVFVLPEIDGG